MEQGRVRSHSTGPVGTSSFLNISRDKIEDEFRWRRVFDSIFGEYVNITINCANPHILYIMGIGWNWLGRDDNFGTCFAFSDSCAHIISLSFALCCCWKLIWGILETRRIRNQCNFKVKTLCHIRTAVRNMPFQSTSLHIDTVKSLQNPFPFRYLCA